MASRTRWLLVAALALALLPPLLNLSGCAGPAHRNDPVSAEQLTAIRYSLRFPRVEGEAAISTTALVSPLSLPRSNTYSLVDGSPFVGISLSGGGSRAAAFGLAVLQELQQIGLLGKSTAMTSVSGGGLAAGLYATRGPDIRWEDAHTDVGQNFIRKWALKQLNPVNIAKVIFTAETRTDLMAEVFNETLFSRATFGSLGVLAPGRPVWVPTATATSNKGRRFLFNEDSFYLLGSDLGKFPIARAVMASAAFPGVFNTMTLQRFDGSEKSAPRFVHLIDGGPSDNLGITTLGELASAQLRLNDPQRGAPDSCVMIVVDSYAPGTEHPRVAEFDTRGVVGRLIDLNFLDAFDSLLNRRRDTLLRSIGLLKGPERALDVGGIVGLSEPVSAIGASVGDKVSLPYGFVKTVNFGLIREGEFESANVRPARPGDIRNREVQCLVWHLPLDKVASVPPYKLAGTSVDYFQYKDQVVKAIPQAVFRRELMELVTSVPTHFKLIGPAGCSAEQTQRALRLAARILVRENFSARKQVCEHFEDAQARMRPVSAKKDQVFLKTCTAPPPEPAGASDLGFRIVKDHATDSLRCGPL